MNNALREPITPARWTKFTFLGWLLGVILIMLFSSWLDTAGIENMQFYVGMGMGTGVGFTQWRLLRKHNLPGAGWIWASVVGMSLPFIVFDLLLPVERTYKLPLSVAIGGLLTGALQSFSMKPYKINTPGWIFTSFIGWSLAVTAVLMVNFTMYIKCSGNENLLLALLNLVLILSGGPILGIITGRKMGRMMSNIED